MRIYFIALILAFSFVSSCSQNAQEAFYNTNFKRYFDKISKTYCKYINRKTVILTDFVDFNTLQPTTEGKFLTEYFRDSLINTCKRVKIYQLELRKSFKMTPYGISALTRKVEKIKNKKVSSKYLITGTYKMTENFVTVFTRLIDIKTGKIILTKTERIIYYIKNPFADDPFDI